MNRATIIINPIAGSGRSTTIAARSELGQSILAAHGYDVRVCITTTRQTTPALCGRAVRARTDSSWRGAAMAPSTAPDRLATPVPLAIVPVDRAMDWRGSGLPLDAAQAHCSRRDRRHALD